MFPEKLKDVNSYLQLMWIPNYFKLDLPTMLWFGLPFYYPKFKREDLPPSALAYHERLLKLNSKILISISLYFATLLLIAWAAYYFN